MSNLIASPPASKVILDTTLEEVVFESRSPEWVRVIISNRKSQDVTPYLEMLLILVEHEVDSRLYFLPLDKALILAEAKKLDLTSEERQFIRDLDKLRGLVW